MCFLRASAGERGGREGGVQLQDSCWRSADTADRNKQRSPTGASRTGEVNTPLKADRGHLTVIEVI